jgi:chorismate mutase
MQPLRKRVDKIDLKMLQLLQQRTKLSGQIGAMKRRHGAVVYVPERERELVARLSRLSKGKLPAKAVAALYREILSSSRAAQGQAPIGLLKASAPVVLPASRACFGACDQFSPKKSWGELAKGLGSGALSLALLTGNDLASALRTPQWQNEFFHRLVVVGDFVPSETQSSLGERIFIVTPRETGVFPAANRILILIECKSTQNAIKSLLHSMPDFSIHAEQLSRRAGSSPRGAVTLLARLSLARPADGLKLTSRVLAAAQATGMTALILGIYPASEVYGG